MANHEHIEILRRGVKEWNKWRKVHLDIKLDFIEADLRGADLSEANLTGARLNKANLSGASLRNTNLSGANLRRAILRKAKLSGAKLSGTILNEANLSGAILIQADLSEADLTKAKLRGADLTSAELRGANLSWTNLTMANLFEANLSRTKLTGAVIIRADLSGAIISEAIIENACLKASRLLNANFDWANLTGARLWETQRAGWSIKGVVCESAYWDKEGKKLDIYEPGEFERLYSEKARVQIKYSGGISTLEIATLPGLIQHLEALHPGATLRFESVQVASGGAIVNLVFDDAIDISPEQIEELRTAIQLDADREAHQFRLALKEKEDLVLRLEGQLQTFQWTFRELLLQSKPNQLLIMGGVEMGDRYNIPGQAGAVGPNAHAHDNTFNQLQQIGSRIAESMDLTALASELETLRQALKKEATTEEHGVAVADSGTAKRAAEAKDSAKLAESLKSAGKWALDVAKEIGVSLATEAIKQSTGMK
jgi:uncharacterized protein YjbI with pentapeptide repeats